MKLAIFGDLHLGIRHNSTEWHEVALEWADAFIAQLKERGIRDIVFLGDFFHNRNTISVNTLNVANKFMQKFGDFNIHMVLGNHDLFYDNEFTTSGVNLFDNFTNVHVYAEPKKVMLGGKQFEFCGWGYDPMLYDADVLFTHAEVAMFKVNKNSEPSEDGYKISELLKHYEVVYSGHYHVRQSKVYDRGQVRYVGNPFAMDFSDEDVEKGFEVYDTESGEIEFVRNDFSPKYHSRRLSDLLSVGDFDEIGALIGGSHFKLIVDKSVTQQDMDRLMNIVNSYAPADSSFEWENGKAFSQNVEGFEGSAFDIRTTIAEYIDLLDVPDKPWIKKYIFDLYTKVDCS